MFFLTRSLHAIYKELLIPPQGHLRFELNPQHALGRWQKLAGDIDPVKSRVAAVATLVNAHKDEVPGALLIRHRGPRDRLELAWPFIAEEYRRHGWGRYLVMRALQCCWETDLLGTDNHVAVVINAKDNNEHTAVTNFWWQCGFRRSTESPNAYFGKEGSYEYR